MDNIISRHKDKKSKVWFYTILTMMFKYAVNYDQSESQSQNHIRSPELIGWQHYHTIGQNDKRENFKGHVKGKYYTLQF